jgi:tetratricopeptide (TPR) repeat protein
MRVGDALYFLGSSYDDSGQYGKAEETLRRALSIYERILGPNHAYPVSTGHLDLAVFGCARALSYKSL